MLKIPNIIVLWLLRAYSVKIVFHFKIIHSVSQLFWKHLPWLLFRYYAFLLVYYVINVLISVHNILIYHTGFKLPYLIIKSLGSDWGFTLAIESNLFEWSYEFVLPEGDWPCCWGLHERVCVCERIINDRTCNGPKMHFTIWTSSKTYATI